MRKALIGIAFSLGVASAAGAADTLWTVAVGSHAISLTVRESRGEPAADIRLLAHDLDLDVQEQSGRVIIRDTQGQEWHTAHGSVLLEGPRASRRFASPVDVSGGRIYLPLAAIAELAGKKLVVESPGRAALVPAPLPSRGGDVPTPAGWQSFQITKTPDERAEMRRLGGTPLLNETRPVVKEILPAAHEAMNVELGLGFTQGATGASDVMATGTSNGFRVNFAAFLTFGHEGTLYRSGHFRLDNPAATWTVEAGDLSSDMRGLSRGARVVANIRSRWHPGLSVYAYDPHLAPDRAALAYRDEVQITPNISTRGEAASDGSGFVAARWTAWRASVETFFRHAVTRGVDERGGMISYDAWKGINLRAGGRMATGRTPDRWYIVGVSVPIANAASVSLEQTRTETIRGTGTNSALGFMVPLGRVRFMQRYQITDVAFVEQPLFPLSEQRQLQSMASWTVTSRLQFNYQAAAQWLPGGAVRQWTELQSVLRISPSTSFHAVTGFPQVDDPQRFRIGIQQSLPGKFRLSVDYGRLPAFQSLLQDRVDAPRLLVMVRRGFGIATPARGSDIEGRVIDEAGRPVSGAAVSLGPYVTTARPDGRYQFSNVPAGDFPLGLVRDGLPAQYTSDATHQSLHLQDVTRASVDLHAVPLDAIHGHVYIDRNGNGAFDLGEGVARVVVRLSSADRATMTDDGGFYGFYNLPPGPYHVRIDAERLRSDLVVASDVPIDVQLEAGHSRTGVDFPVALKQKPIVMQKIPE